MVPASGIRAASGHSKRWGWRVLQNGPEINQQISATDQVQVGKRRVLDDILLCENAQIPDGFMDLVSAVVADKETVELRPWKFRQPRLLHRRRRARSRAKSLISVAKIWTDNEESRKTCASCRRPKKFEEDHRQGVNLLPGGTAGNPYPQRAVLGLRSCRRPGEDLRRRVSNAPRRGKIR